MGKRRPRNNRRVRDIGAPVDRMSLSRVGRPQMLEPAALASRIVRGSPDPPDTPDRAVFRRALMGTLFGFQNSPTTVVNTITTSMILSYEGLVAYGTYVARFREFRLQRIEVWGSSTEESGDVALVVSIAPTLEEGDGAIFRDYATPGNRRQHIAFVPNFAVRERWYTANNENLFSVTTAATPTATVSPILRLTLELR